jgi:hypothetical protein
VNAVIPWVRSVVAFPLALVAIKLFHAAGRHFLPMGYGELASDNQRLLSLTLATVAGIVGSFVVGAVARHRIWLHMAIFLALMLVLDIGFLKTSAAAQPLWFKALVIATLPLQVWIGARLAMLTFRKSSLPAAI